MINFSLHHNVLCLSFVVVLYSTYSLYAVINPPMVKPFRLTYLARGGGGVVATTPLEILTITCLTFRLLLTDRPTLGLPEYKLKVVSICKMHGTGVLKLWCYVLFDRFQRYVEIVRKSDEKVL